MSDNALDSVIVQQFKRLLRAANVPYGTKGKLVNTFGAPLRRVLGQIKWYNPVTGTWDNLYKLAAYGVTETIIVEDIINGYITSATPGAVTLTMPTALALAQAMNARAGTSVCFIMYNSGANNLTLAVNTGITTIGTPLFTGGNNLVLSSANTIANYELVFTSVTNGGTGAAVTPTISGGAVTGFGSVTAGSGYTKPPIVQISGGGGRGATAVCTLSGSGVATVTLLTGGTGYTSVPVVTFITDDAITAATAKIIRTT